MNLALISFPPAIDWRAKETSLFWYLANLRSPFDSSFILRYSPMSAQLGGSVSKHDKRMHLHTISFKARLVDAKRLCQVLERDFVLARLESNSSRVPKNRNCSGQIGDLELDQLEPKFSPFLTTIRCIRERKLRAYSQEWLWVQPCGS